MRINHTKKVASIKIVYFGAGLAGKTLNLEYIFQNLPKVNRIADIIKHAQTEGDRRLYFDFLPMGLGIDQKIGNYTVELHLYTVPGQSHYEMTRRKVLEGADGIVFVADSQKQLQESNIISMEEMKKHLTENKLDFVTIPLILQFNKRDLPNIMPDWLMLHDLKRDENQNFFNTSAIKGENILETLRAIAKDTISSKLRK